MIAAYRVVVILLVCVGVCLHAKATESQRKGAVVALTKYWRVPSLITRNQAVFDNLWQNGSMDVLVFHQDDIDKQQQLKIQAGTPLMPITFISIEKLFRRTQKPALTFNNPHCPNNKMSTMTPPGYKTMCHFFAYKFRDYLKAAQYDWMLRIDDDCFLRSNVKKHFPPRPLHDGMVPHVMSPNWIIDGGGPDSLRDERPGTEAGLLTHGLRRMAYEYAKEANISRSNINLFPTGPADDYTAKLTGNGSQYYSIYDLPEEQLYHPVHMNKMWKQVEKYHDRHIWPSPATNTFYLNLTWLYATPVVTNWMNRVEKSKCVFSNRWGDLPIWGTTLALADEPLFRWDINVEHTSHRCVYMSRKHPLQGNHATCNDVYVPEILDYS